VAVLCLTLLLCAWLAPPAFAESLSQIGELPPDTAPASQSRQQPGDSGGLTRPYLTGDWGGARPALEEKGFVLDLRYTSFYQGLVEGTGKKDFEYGGKVDALIDLDFGKMGLWEGGSVRSHIEFNHGDLAANLGGALFSTNIAMYFPVGSPNEVVATSLNYTHQFGERGSLGVGKFNPVDVYALHPFYGGWGVDRFMSVVLTAPPSGLIPVVFMGFLATLNTATANWTAMIADPNDRTDDYFPGDLFEDGVLLAVNATHATTMAGRGTTFGITGLYSTAEGVDYSTIGGGVVNTSNKSGAYNVNVQFTHNLQETGGPNPAAWGFYLKAGIADGNPNYVKRSVILGIGGHALFFGRPQDRFGAGVYYYNLSDVLEDTINPAAIIGDEAAFEIFYNFEVTPWLLVGPDIQYVKPARQRFKDAWVMGLRMQTRF
jgi:porin